jgi:opacity protein-like surface antigen
MKFRHIFAVAGLSLSPAGAALAFDMPPPIDAPEITTVSAASGWYIRGDLGYNSKIDTDAPTVRDFSGATLKYTTDTFDPYRLNGDYSLSAGMGYQFNDFLRSDVTLDYFQATMKTKSDWKTPCTQDGGTAYLVCAYDQQRLSALGLLGNAYVDLGTYMGVTPYVGAGAGVSYVQWGDVQQRTRCVYTKNAKDCNSIDTQSANKDGIDSWRFTYALMTGVSYDISSTMKLDLGYRFSRIGQGGMFDFSSYEQSIGAFGTKGRDKGFSRHEFRAGLRVVGW